MANEHPDVVTFRFDERSADRLAALRGNREDAMARFVDPSFEFPANHLVAVSPQLQSVAIMQHAEGWL